MEDQIRYCSECGSQESGYFCRNCGALLTGEDNVLCPRCHHIVPDGKFCNQCGQGLSGIGLHLRQLALAGDTFWVASGEPTPAVSTPAPAEAPALEPDESVELAQADLPDWLREIPISSSVAERARADEHIYPALKPIEPAPAQRPQRSFLMAVLVLMFVMLLGIVFMAVLVALRGMG
ncbi:MAG: hypothetical protein JXM73_23650 [Anaerolineae bacterium]|nr:hypothetical protein [Anaerolineae bacterium]